MNILQSFLNAPGVKRSEPATLEQLNEFEAKTGLKLPDVARELYLASDGASVAPLKFEILSLEQSLAEYEEIKTWPWVGQWSYFPLTDNYDGSPYCIACVPPMDGRIVHVLIDDASTLDFRNLEFFLAAIVGLLTSGDSSARLDGLQAQYENAADRNTSDESSALALLELAPRLSADDPGAGDAYLFAIRLFSNKQADKLASLLEGSQLVGWPDIRAIALKRLEGIQTPEARHAVENYRQAFEQFKREAVAALQNASVQVGEMKHDCVRLEPGPIWLDLGGFFPPRNDADFSKVIRHAKRLLSEKNS